MLLTGCDVSRIRARRLDATVFGLGAGWHFVQAARGAQGRWQTRSSDSSLPSPAVRIGVAASGMPGPGWLGRFGGLLSRGVRVRKRVFRLAG